MNIEEFVKTKLKGIDLSEVVQQEVREIIREPILREIRKYMGDRIIKIIDEEIEIVMNKAIQIDDGWGKNEKFNTFEDLFKRCFAEKMSKTWEIQNLFERVTKKHIEELWKKNMNIVVLKLTDEIKGLGK